MSRRKREIFILVEAVETPYQTFDNYVPEYISAEDSKFDNVIILSDTGRGRYLYKVRAGTLGIIVEKEYIPVWDNAECYIKWDIDERLPSPCPVYTPGRIKEIGARRLNPETGKIIQEWFRSDYNGPLQAA